MPRTNSYTRLRTHTRLREHFERARINISIYKCLHICKERHTRERAHSLCITVHANAHPYRIGCLTLLRCLCTLVYWYVFEVAYVHPCLHVHPLPRYTIHARKVCTHIPAPFSSALTHSSPHIHECEIHSKWSHTRSKVCESLTRVQLWTSFHKCTHTNIHSKVCSHTD